MAGNDLISFDPKGQLPAHTAKFFGEESNIANRQTVPSLTYEGKVWTISLNGEKTKLLKRNSDGDEEPVSTMKVVVLDYAKRRGRQYYEGVYDPSKVSAPICWSDDGIAPDASVPAHPSDKLPNKPSKCSECPMSVKGSKIIEGTDRQVTACSQHRMLAVVPANKLDFEPLRLKIAITSDFDKQSPQAEAQGWFAFSNYTDFLKSRGVQHTAALVTKIKFDQTAAYPKLFFAADSWLNEEQLAQVAPIAKSEGVRNLLSGTWTPAGVDGVKKEELAAPHTYQDEQAKSNGTDDEDDEIGNLPADEPKQEAAQVDTPAPEPAKAVKEPKKAAAKAEKATPEVVVATDPTLDKLLAEWGDD